MNSQQQAAFEAWAASIGFCVTGKYAETIGVLCAKSAFKAGYQAGRAALQSQVKKDTTLFCDLKTDEEKYTFFLMGRGYETGVIAQAIQNDVAMTYHRCAEYEKEVKTLRNALNVANDALEEISNEMTFGDRWTNAGQSLLDALPITHAALSQEKS